MRTILENRIAALLEREWSEADLPEIRKALQAALERLEARPVKSGGEFAPWCGAIPDHVPI